MLSLCVYYNLYDPYLIKHCRNSSLKYFLLKGLSCWSEKLIKEYVLAYENTWGYLSSSQWHTASGSRYQPLVHSLWHPLLYAISLCVYHDIYGRLQHVQRHFCHVFELTFLRERWSVRPEKNCQMSIEVAQKWFDQKNDRFWHLYKCGRFGQNNCCRRL